MRISVLISYLSDSDHRNVGGSNRGTDPRCGNTLCWPKEWFFIGHGTRCTVDSVNSRWNFGLYLETSSRRSLQGPTSIERCDLASTICPEQMYSWQVDKLTLHPGLFSYELVSQNLETWAVGTLDESGIMAQWDRWKQLILETSEASGIPRLQCRGSWGALHIGRWQLNDGRWEDGGNKIDGWWKLHHVGYIYNYIYIKHVYMYNYI